MTGGDGGVWGESYKEGVELWERIQHTGLFFYKHSLANGSLISSLAPSHPLLHICPSPSSNSLTLCLFPPSLPSILPQNTPANILQQGWSYELAIFSDVEPPAFNSGASSPHTLPAWCLFLGGSHIGFCVSFT